jgi:hypothetical protein
METEITSMVAAFAALILLAVTAMRYGVDSREAFVSEERELAARGMEWGIPSATPQRRKPAPRRAEQRPRNGEECPVIPCAA